MEKSRLIKIVILFIMASLSSLLTLLDLIIPDPIPLLDEIGFGGVTTALWGYFILALKKSKDNTKKLPNK